MSIYDEDGPDYPEDTFTPPDPTEKPVMEVKISNYDLGRMIDFTIAHAIEKHTKKALDKWVEKKVAKAVDALVKEISADTIKAAVEKQLAEGWSKVNQWGEQQGEKITLSTAVREGLLAMTQPGGDHYNRKPAPMVAIVQEMATAAVKDGLQPLLDEAKAQLKTSLDVQFGKGLRLTLADVLRTG